MDIDPSLPRVSSPQDGMWVELITHPPAAEVTVESEPVISLEAGRCSVTGRALWTPTSEDSNSVGLEDSLHFQRNGSMQTVTQFIGRDVRTSFEHVNQIIKHGAEAAKNRSRSTTPVMIENHSPTGLNHRNPAQHVVKKVIVIQPWDDPEKAAADAISKITENLNREAAQRLAEGDTPDKETVIEITQINTPANQEAGRVSPLETHIMMEEPKSPQPSSLDSPEESERKHRRRKSPHPKRYMYHTPSPPQGKSRSAHSRSAHSLSAHCYFESAKPSRPSSHTTASSKLLGLSTRPGAPPQPTNPAQPSSAATQPTVSAKLQAAIHSAQTSKPTILRTVRMDGATGPSAQCVKYRITRPVRTSVGLERPASATPMDVSDGNLENKDPAASPTVTGKLNESLTNIQWLGALSGESLEPAKPSIPAIRDPRTLVSDRQIDKISQECGRKKRPPYSYMHLIQMAICSKDDKRSTLKEIYKWIEDKFPYYKFCSNQGWKNSIRHNLSLYDIFVREKVTTNQGRPGLSYWTLRGDVPLKTNKALQTIMADSVHTSSQESSDSGCLSQTGYYYTDDLNASLDQGGSTGSSRNKKGPVPLLPKPPPLQTYALIPIQHGVPVIPQTPIMVSSPTLLNQSQRSTPTLLNQSQRSTPTLLNQSQRSTPTLLNQSQHRKTDPHLCKTVKIRPSSATEFVKRTPALASDVLKVKRPGSAFELLRSSGSIGAASESLLRAPVQHRGADGVRIAPTPAEACSLLAGVEVKREGMSTPPPTSNDDLLKSTLKRSLSPSEVADGPGSQRKHVKIAPRIDVYDDQTHTVQHYWHRGGGQRASSTVTNASVMLCDSSQLDATSSDLWNKLSNMKFADSGFISDSSTTLDHTGGEEVGLPKPKMYLAESNIEGGGYVLTSTPSDCESEPKGGAFLSIDCENEAGLHDILSSIEKSLSSPMRNLLRTPPKSAEKNMFTSTPFKVAFGSPSWLSPIKGLTPLSGDTNADGNLCTPVKIVSSTPSIKAQPLPKIVRTPPNSTVKRETTTNSLNNFTPLKTPFKSPLSRDMKSERSPGDLFGNQSFSKLIGECHFESMIDEGINLDVSNMSFSALQ